MVVPEAYAYPDEDDRITSRFIEEAEPFPGYWAESDERAMARAGAELAKLLGPRETVRALDAGCGPGRMFPWLARLAATIVAVDPDAARLAVGAEVAHGLGADITTLTTDVHDLVAEPFDLVLCSHVIQHIPTAELVPLLTRLGGFTAPGGLLMLTYTRAPVGEERYTLDRIAGSGVESEVVDRARFDEATRGGRDAETLPIHHRDPVRLAELGRSLGWTQLWSWSFHVLDSWPAFGPAQDRDELVNASPDLLRRFGRDVVVLWRRQTPTG